MASVRQMPNEDEILSLSDDSENEVDKTGDGNHSEYSDEDVASISDDDENFGSENDSMDYSDEDEGQCGDSKGNREDSESDVSPQKRSAERPSTAAEHRSAVKDRLDEPPAERSINW